MSSRDSPLPRLRQAVLAAADLDAVAARLQEKLGLGEPYADPGVAHFGLRNAVFALGDTFLEVVSPVAQETAAGRLLERRGGDCGYMLMFQVDDLGAARGRVREQSVREVFEVELDEMAEVHLHPADMRGAIVSLSTPRPPSAWRWGGPGWEQRSARSVSVAGARVGVAGADRVRARWSDVLGADVAVGGVEIVDDDADPGLVEVVIASADGASADRRGEPIEIGGVRFSFVPEQEDVS